MPLVRWRSQKIRGGGMPLKQFSSALVLAALLAGCSSNGDSRPPKRQRRRQRQRARGHPAADGRCDANAVQEPMSASRLPRPSSRRPAAPERSRPGAAPARCGDHGLQPAPAEHRCRRHAGDQAPVLRLTVQPRIRRSPHRGAFRSKRPQMAVLRRAALDWLTAVCGFPRELPDAWPGIPRTTGCAGPGLPAPVA